MFPTLFLLISGNIFVLIWGYKILRNWDRCILKKTCLVSIIASRSDKKFHYPKCPQWGCRPKKRLFLVGLCLLLIFGNTFGSIWGYNILKNWNRWILKKTGLISIIASRPYKNFCWPECFQWGCRVKKLLIFGWLCFHHKILTLTWL